MVKSRRFENDLKIPSQEICCPPSPNGQSLLHDIFLSGCLNIRLVHDNLKVDLQIMIEYHSLILPDIILGGNRANKKQVTSNRNFI